jgi:hypothetical protein
MVGRGVSGDFVARTKSGFFGGNEEQEIKGEKIYLK